MWLDVLDGQVINASLTRIVQQYGSRRSAIDNAPPATQGGVPCPGPRLGRSVEAARRDRSLILGRYVLATYRLMRRREIHETPCRCTALPAGLSARIIGAAPIRLPCFVARRVVADGRSIDWQEGDASSCRPG